MLLSRLRLSELPFRLSRALRQSAVGWLRIAAVSAILVAIGLGCAPVEKIECPALKQPTQSAVRGAYFEQRGTTPAIVLGVNEGTACYTLGAGGLLGERFCQVRYWEQDPNSVLPFGTIIGAVLTDDRLALYSNRYVVRASFGMDHATVTLLSFEVGGDDPQLARFFNEPNDMYGIWTSTNADGTTTAGLAQIGNDDIVRAVGAPFFSGNAVSAIFGAFDPETDRFLVDSPDGITLVELDRNGNLLAATPHGQASGTGMATHLAGWTRLSTGGWVGLNGGWLCNFDPHDRTTETCFRMQLSLDVPTADSLPMALNVDAGGSLWALFRVIPSDQAISPGITLGRYDGKDRFDGNFVPLTLDTCDELVGLD